MKNTRRIGLALSGGGLRASIFHLGLVRFLRDAGLLPQVAQITSVSGGSVLAAHLALNWDRYCGSPEQFDAAASEFLKFVSADVRNRIVRRYPFTIPIALLRALTRRRFDRRFTRTGLLETHYKQLYGDLSLLELPAYPQLHILSTNLTEGGLCSFTRDGLIMQRRAAGNGFRFERVTADLATLAMAVTASSAFPGFYPPLTLTSSDVGAAEGEFGRQSFTDGGVFDNLGLRMFRYIERYSIGRELRLSRDDFLDIQEVMKALKNAKTSTDDEALHQVAKRLADERFDNTEQLLEGLTQVMVDSQLYRDSALSSLQLPSLDAQALLEYARLPHVKLDRGDHVWLNRQFLGALFERSTGKPCVHPLSMRLDCVLASDAGKPFEIASQAASSGVIGTSLRATDILMDRVGQLENETFRHLPRLVFASTMGEVRPDEDETALPLEIQRRLGKIRTDMDRFSPIEVSSLLQHGYCIGRKACKNRPDLFGNPQSTDPPWDPFSTFDAASALAHPAAETKTPTSSTQAARILHASAKRRILSTFFDYRDWISYIYVPLLVAMLTVAPYVGYTMYQQSHVIRQLRWSLSQSAVGIATVFHLLEDNPVPAWDPMPVEEVSELAPPDFAGFDICQDTRIFDARKWHDRKKTNSSSAYEFRCVNFKKSHETSSNNSLRFQYVTSSANVIFRSPNHRLNPKLRRVEKSLAENNQVSYVWEISFDLSNVPIDKTQNVIIEARTLDGIQGCATHNRWVKIDIDGEPAALVVAVIMPNGKPHDEFDIIAFNAQSPDIVQAVEASRLLQMPEGQLLAWTLYRPNPDYTYECHWTWRD